MSYRMCAAIARTRRAATNKGITFSGAIGCRALYVDYAQGEGRQRYGFDMLQHGPVLGNSTNL